MTYLIIFSLLFFCLGIYLTQQLLPGDFKPLPQKNSTRSLIYVPDRDTNWIFENLWSQQDDTINFGDVAVGDSWFPLIDFYNNSRDPEVFDVSIDGMDKNDFEILWRVEDNQPFVPQILPDVLQRLYIKFRPLDYNNLGSKTATLTFTSVSNKNNKKSIFLKANSSRLDNGYSLFFDNPGDMLILDPQKNILGDNYTFEFWLKPRITGDYNQTAILQNDNGSNHKFYLDINKDSSLSLFVNSRKAVERIIFLKSSSKLKLSEWNHVAFSVSPDKIFLILNNSYSEMKTYSEITRNISDRIYFGFSKSPEKIKPESLTNAGFQYLISGLSVWNKIIDSDYLINNKYKRKQGSESNLLFAYNFSEANWETVFDLSPNDYWGSLRGGIKRKLDSPFNPPYSEHSPGNSENKILHLKDKSLMFFTKTLFDKPSSFSVQVDAKFIVKDTGMAGSFFDLSHPDILLRTDIYKSYIDLHYNNSKSNMALSEKKEFYTAGEWHNYLFVYSLDKDLAALFIDSLLFLEIKLPEKFDISRWYYGMSFGGRHFFYAPLYFNQESFIDNVKIFRGAVWKNNTFTFLPDSLLAFWSFEKNNKELIIDNINNYPAFLYNNFEILHSN